MDGYSTLFAGLAAGAGVALSAPNLAYCFAGVFLGMAVGVLPGFGTLSAISLLFPITFYLDTTSALIMLAGIHYGASYGGSITAILLKVPGQASSAITCIDGYEMARKGRAGVALLMTTVASFIGGSIGILLMMTSATAIAGWALKIGPAEHFALMLFGLIGASTMSAGSMAKGISMVVLGALLGLVGSDQSSGMERFTFDVPELIDGLNLVAVTVGLFGVSEVIEAIGAKTPVHVDAKNVAFRSMLPTRDDVSRSWFPTLRGSAIGCLSGILPGLGGTIASFVAYSLERRVARDPSQLGKGAIEGIVSPEAANNAADQTNFIPMMALGIPGSANMAIMLAMLMIHGIAPGPQFVTDRPDMFWGVVISFWIGNLMLVILNVPLIGMWVRVLMIPARILHPAILVFVCIGVYTVNYSSFDVWMVVAFGGLGYALRLLDFSVAPLVLGFVLGPLIEVQFRRAMIISRGDASIFFDRPISGTIMVAALALLVWGLWSMIRPPRQR